MTLKIFWFYYLFYRLEQKENETIIVKIESEKKMNELLKLLDKKKYIFNEKNSEKKT